MSPIHSTSENPAWRDIIVNSVFNWLTIVVIGLRFYSRRLTRAGFGWDDGVIALSALVVNAMLIVAGGLLNLGFGLPQDQISRDTFPEIMQLGRAFRLLFLFCICTVKLSALFFYLRVFGNRTLRGNILPRPNSTNAENKTPVSTFSLRNMSSSWRSFWEHVRRPSLRLVCIVLIYLVITWTVINVVREVTICGFTKHICGSHRATDLETCAINAFGDLLIFVLPLRSIWRLQMARSTKIGLSIVILLGTMTVTVSLLRFEAIVDTDYSGDYNRTAMKSINYAILEPNLAILCLSLPMLQPLLRKVRSKIPTGSLRRSGWWAGSRRGDKTTSHGPLSSSGFGEDKSTASSVPRSADYMNLEPAAAVVLARAGIDDDDDVMATTTAADRNYSQRSRNRDENLIAKVKRVWNRESRGSSQDDMVELASRQGISVTMNSETGSYRREDWPLTPFRGVTITTITAGNP